MPVIHSLFTPDIEKLRRSGDIEGLIRILRNHETSDLRKVEVALISLGEPSIGPLIAALQDPDRRVREVAVEALGGLRSPLAIGPLIEALKDEEWHIRFLATLGLVEMGKEVVDDLVSALVNEDRDIRLGAAWALGEIKDVRAVMPLILTL
ncbi:MAG: HEAT repeat domain-containing protein, partial [Methanomicrobiales archaeon]|nr:HEAT repeat domain-containing protein [Methanomicrobiales archaeon]